MLVIAGVSVGKAFSRTERGGVDMQVMLSTNGSHGEKGINAIAKLEDGKHSRVVLNEQHVGQGDEPTLRDIREALIAVYGTDYGLRCANYISRFTDMARQAASYRDRRVLLASDAAHVHPPMGGQGLNLGVQDAVNLGWKLAQVVHRTSLASLLETYHAERHPVGARVLRNTMALSAVDRGDDRIGALREVMSELLQADTPRKQHLAMMSGLDIRYDFGEGHALLGRRMLSPPMARCGPSPCCTMPGRCSATSVSLAASTSLHGQIAFS